MPTALAVAVLAYRESFIERTIPIDACSFVRVLNDRSDYPAKVPPWLRSHFDRQDSDPCVPLPSSAQPGASTPAKVAVTFEPLATLDSASVVRLLVRADENIHHEDYKVRKLSDSGWAVSEVRIWGAARMHFVSP
ncbi:MAG: hypothetical protein ABI969_09350 [bacterium]